MTQSAEPTHPPPSKVLIVDDNPQNLELLAAYVEGMDNVEVLTAPDGPAALEVVADRHPDLILLDVMMPRMSGFEVCRTIKGDPATADIPVIMVTALNEMGDLERGLASGTDDFLSKPINRLELTTRITSLLKVRHLKGELDRTMAYFDEMDRLGSQPDPKGTDQPDLENDLDRPETGTQE